MKKIIIRLDRIETMINAMLSQKKFLTIDEAALYLDFSKNYLYKLTHLNVLPFYRPNGKKIFFKRTELDLWIQKHKCSSIDEIQNSKTKK